ncbi:MAG TPA: SRPBCC family protein [Mycobacteriales bacterium]|nr:SRPBCC family protein [Mycobacteriales bacterium]
MAHNSRLIRGARVNDVFAVLSDGWTYSDWVVGTRKIREVEPGWPQAGSAIHYTAGHWPLRKDDITESVQYEPERRLELEAHAWPAGTAGIVLRAEQVSDGVVVTIDEAPKSGLLRAVHNPALDLLIRLRNVETLRRFEQQVRQAQRGSLRTASG